MPPTQPGRPSPVRRRPSRKAITSDSSDPALAIHSHSDGARSAPSSEKGVVKSTGSGFHDGPPSVTRSRCVISLPHMIQAHGSYVGVDGNSSVSAATARQPTITGSIGPERGPAKMPEGVCGRTAGAWAAEAFI